MHLFRIFVLLLVWLASPAYAQTPRCDSLADDQKPLATELLASQHSYGDCDDTLAKCLEQRPLCSLAFRLAENICRRVADGQPREKIVEALWRRKRAFSPSEHKARIDLRGLSLAGDANAPITLVEYACPRCPYCASITPKIYDAVVEGPLEGKVKFYFKTFPLRGHPDAKESGLAFVAAGRLGHFWDFVLYFFQRFSAFSLYSQLEWAEACGMNRKVFQTVMADPATRQSLVEMKKEGIVNDVHATPTFFVNGRRYRAELSPEEVIDVLEEEFDRLQGIRHRP